MLGHLYEILLERSARLPGAIALGSQEGATWKTLNSAELLGTVDRLAEDLAIRGVREGDRIVTWLPGAWQTPVYMFALWKLGAITVPFDREVNQESAASIIASVEPRLILTGYGESPPWAPDGGAIELWRPEITVARAAGARWVKPQEELAAVFFTSGTTGNPKGCMITHANLCSQIDAVSDVLPIDDSCRLASVLPLSHLFELTCGLLYPLTRGAAIHYVPSRKGPDIIKVLQEQRVTHMNAVPQLLSIMGKALDERLRSQLPSGLYRAMAALAERAPTRVRRLLFWMVHRKLGGQLRLMTSAAAPLDPEVRRLWERIGVQILEGYGTSECSPVVTASNLAGGTPSGSVGKAIRGVEVRLSAEGELLVKGPNVMRGYWRDPVRTADVLKDGWYCSGDLATIDPAGNVTLAGRARDLIVMPSGMKVWPQDLEEVLRDDPAVKDASVIPVPAPGGGLRLHAYLVPAKDRAEDPRKILGRANARLAQHQQISSASWWADIDFPRTLTLKVKRHLLPMPEQQPVRAPAPAPVDDPVVAAVMESARADQVGVDQTLGELGMDSMGLVQLALAIEERTGKVMGDGDLRLELTVGQVMELAGKAPGRVAATGRGRWRRPRPAASAGTGTASRAKAGWQYTWGRAFRWLGFPLDLVYRLVITDTMVLGRENLEGLPEAVIFAGTHHSFADVSLVRNSLARTAARRFAGRIVVAAAADGWGAAGIWAQYAALAFGVFPLKRYGAGKQSLEDLAAVARAGNAVLVFPQGTHARPEQERAQERSVAFRMGAAHLVRDLGVVVVPFGLAGTEEAMPPYLENYRGPVIAGIPLSARRVPLAIAYGKPMRAEPDEDLLEFTRRLQDVCYELTRQAEAALAKAKGGQR